MRKIPLLPLFILWFVLPVLSVAQTSVIKVLEENTGEPLPFVHVCFESLDKSNLSYHITDKEGVIANDIASSASIAISYVGFVTVIDTIQPASSYTFYLKHSQFELDEIVVTGQFTPQRADQSIYRVNVLNRKDIQDRSASNLSDLLKTELNLRTYQDAALGSGISIQGLTGEHVKILVDGVPVIGRMNGQIDLSQINLFNTDHVEIVEGPMSVIYGSNALAGAINIITAENSRERVLGKVHTLWESIGIYNVDASATVRTGSHRFYLGGARHFFSGYSEEKDSRTKQWKPKLQYNLDGYWLYSNNRLKLKADARMFDETIQNKGPIFDTPPLYGKAFDTYFYTRRVSYKGLLSYKRYAESNLDVIFSYNRFNRTKNTFTKDLTTLTEIINPDPSLHDTTLFQSVIARTTYSGKISGWSTAYQAGIDANLETGEGERIKDGYQEIGDYAGFLSLKQPLGQSIALQAGARYGYNTRYKSPLVPTLNVRFSPMDKLVTRISYARGFRAPSLKELYLFFVDINHNISGNENLKAEYSNNITGSVNYTIENDKNIYDLETDFFVNRISNNINLAIDTLGVYSYVNIARLNTWGGNLNLKYRLHPRFYAHLGVTLVGKKSSLSSTFADGTKYYYYNDVVAEVNYKLLSRNSQFSIFFKSYGKQPQFYVDEQDNLVEGFIDPYQMLDFTYIKSIMNERMQLSVGAKNILNVRNIAASALTSGAHSSGSGIYPAGYGRTFFISLTYTFSKYD